MSLAALRAEAPQWALSAGLPAPYEDELFMDYVPRIGLDLYSLFEDLNDQTAPLANIRLASVIQDAMPDEWDAYVATLVDDPDRKKYLQDTAFDLFGSNYRRRTHW
jgi:hypothetical protein